MKKNNILRRMLKSCLFLMLTLSIISWSGFRLDVQAVDDPTGKSEKMAADIASAKKRIKNTEAEIKAIRNQTGQVNKRLQELELENENLQAEKRLLEEQIKEAELTLIQRQNEQVEAEQRLIDKKEQYQRRIASMFYFKQRSPYEIILNARGIDGFFSNMRMIAAIAKTDSNMIKDLQYAEQIAEAATEVAKQTRVEFEEFLSKKLEEIKEMEAGIEHSRAEVSELSARLRNRSTELEEVEKELRQKEAAFRAYQEALTRYAGQIGKLNPAGSNAVWPLPAGQEIWSPYGYRTLSFDAGNGYMHTGTDFGGPNIAGSPVVAAWEGVVVNVHTPYPGQMYAPDANFVQISHGGGLGTGYWHLLNTAVTPGQHVAQGQVIGYCGATGMATGPHLHFEIYDETNPKRGIRNTIDPMLYLGAK